MKKVLATLSIFLFTYLHISTIAYCAADAAPALIQATSPNGVSKVTFSLDDKGRPTYAFDFKDRPVTLRSRMGLDLKGNRERGLKDGFEVVSGPRTTGDGYYESCIAVIEGNQIEITV